MTQFNAALILLPMDSAAYMLGCDWGTTSLRLRLVSTTAPAEILAEYRGADGVASVAAASDPQDRAECFKNMLRRAVEALQAKTDRVLTRLPIVISGMASSTIGWQSLPYANLPFNLSGADAVTANLALDDQAVLLVSGVRSDRDIMRGEETELIGLRRLPQVQLALNQCVAILPGTHSKHVEIVDGKIVTFRTFMTGEMYSIISRHSVLRHSIAAGDEPSALLAEPARLAFSEGVREALDSDLLTALFQTRTRQVLQNVPVELNAVFLSGVLIGSEMSALLRREKSGDPIVLCAGSAVSAWYRIALEVAGLGERMLAVSPAKVDQLSLLGQAAMLWRAKSGRVDKVEF